VLFNTAAVPRSTALPTKAPSGLTPRSTRNHGRVYELNGAALISRAVSPNFLALVDMVIE